MAGFSTGLLLSASSIRFARLQFDAGVRYMIPAVPFLLLAASTALARLPLGLATGALPPWLTVLGRNGGQHPESLAHRPPDPTALLGPLLAVLWWPLRSRQETCDESI